MTAQHSILVVEDDPILNRLLVKEVGKAGYEVESAHSWAEARQRIATFAPNLVLLDVNLPDSTGFGPLAEVAQSRPVVMLTAYGSVHQAVQAMRLGAADYLVKPVNLDELELVIRSALERSHLHAQKALHTVAEAAGPQAGMIGASAVMQALRQTIREVAASDVSVLVQGESGSGKELVAQALHAASPRGGENFVAIDCCTLQENLFESELFGHERGAFTGADRRKPGLIEAAASGTLFLDEIGEAGPAIQAKLLRVLETGRFRRVGATADLRADVRIVTATNRDLTARARAGQFREDLYYRLATFTIQVPPLRERASDIPALAEHFIARRRQARGLPPLALAPAALQRLMAYAWPGNIRELRNVIERALILVGQGDAIDVAHLPALDAPDALDRRSSDAARIGGGLMGASLGSRVQTMGAATAFGVGFAGAGASSGVASSAAATDAQGMMVPAPSGDALLIEGEPTLEKIEQQYLGRLLEKYAGNRRKVADALGVSERTAYRMMERHGYK